MTVQRSELYFLFESAPGLFLIHVKNWDVVSQTLQVYQDSILDKAKLFQILEPKAVRTFQNAKEALDNCIKLSNSEPTEVLLNFLDLNMPKANKEKVELGVIDPTLGKNLRNLGYPAIYNKNIVEINRICKLYIKKFMKKVSDLDVTKFQLGLGHNFSRTKIKLDPNRQDKPVQNAVALIENLEKTINTFTMRIKEWYSWHFPELGGIVTDNILLVKAIRLIRNKESFNDRDALLEVMEGNKTVADLVMAAKNSSVGREITEFDMINITRFSDEILNLWSQKQNLNYYLEQKMNLVSPNLKALLGDVLAAKLISHAGSLSNLSKFPASTVQIVGAEKALFRALKSKGNTPKYGILFQSSFIGKASAKNKGRVSRYLANKCSLAARIDNFATYPSNIYGLKMRDQVESRMLYLSSHIATRKNIDVMSEAKKEYDELIEGLIIKGNKKKKKRKHVEPGKFNLKTHKRSRITDEPKKLSKKRKT